MKLKLSGAVALSVMLAACQSSNQGDNKMADAGAIPGSFEDFQRNVNNQAYFAYDSSSLDQQAQSNLAQVAQWSKQYPNVNMTVEGNTDPRGTREYNLALGERRAVAAKNYLTAQGGNPNARTVSYGKDRLPAGPGADESTYARNRVAIVNPS